MADMTGCDEVFPVPSILLADAHAERRHTISESLVGLQKPADVVCTLHEVSDQLHHTHTARIIFLGLPSFRFTCPYSDCCLAALTQLPVQLHLCRFVFLADEISDVRAHGRGLPNPAHILLPPFGKQSFHMILNSLSLQMWLEQRNMASGTCSLHFQSRLTDGFRGARSRAEEQMLRQVLWQTGFNIYESAMRLGIKRETLYYFIRKYRIKRDTFCRYSG